MRAQPTIVRGLVTPIAALIAVAAGAIDLPGPAAGIEVSTLDDRLIITGHSEAPIASFTFGDAAVGRPAIRDLHSRLGVMVTRPCPPRAGIDLADHALIHPGVMLCFSDLSGSDPWRHKTAVRFTGFTAAPAALDVSTVRFAFHVDYLATATDTPDAAVACRETSTVTIADRTLAGHDVRLVDWRADIAPGSGSLVLGDVEEMGFGIRLLKSLAPDGGGRYLASHGGHDEAGVFGRQADWCDASGEVDGRPAGALVVGATPSRPVFHARNAGWLLANPVGRRAYGGVESGAVTIAPGRSLRLRFVLVVHDGLPADSLAAVADAARTSIRER